MANCPQINNTNKASDAIAYVSTNLPCSNVKTCDGLNTVLSKFNAVICSATESVNTLTEDVTNLTEDIMLISEEIETINNQLFECCPICDFTGTADEITTTTTTTSLLPCVCMEIIIAQEDLDDATGNILNPSLNNKVNFITNKDAGCGDVEISQSFSVAGKYRRCIKIEEIGTIVLFYTKDNNPIYYPLISSTYTISSTGCSSHIDCQP